MSWEQRELELERQLEQLSQQQIKMATVVAMAEDASGGASDPQVKEDRALMIHKLPYHSYPKLHPRLYMILPLKKASNSYLCFRNI